MPGLQPPISAQRILPVKDFQLGLRGMLYGDVTNVLNFHLLQHFFGAWHAHSLDGAIV
jgi:hypothetical protein